MRAFCSFLFCVAFIFCFNITYTISQELDTDRTISSTGNSDTDTNITLDELEKLLLSRSPAIGKKISELKASENMVKPSSALPDPMFEIMIDNVGFSKYTVGSEEMSKVGVAINQNILFPGKRSANKEKALGVVSYKTSEISKVKRRLLTDLRGMYAKIYMIDREIEIMQLGLELLETLRSTAAAKYAAAESGQEEVLKVQLEISKIYEELDDLGLERKMENSQINELLDLAADNRLNEVQELPIVRSIPENIVELALNNSPDLELARKSLDLSENDLEIEKLDLKPDFSVGTGIEYRGDMEPVAIFKVGAEIPVFFMKKQKPMIEAKKCEIAAMEQELREMIAQVRSRVFQLVSELENSKRQTDRYSEVIIPQAKAVMEAAKASYIVGSGDFFMVIEDFRMWLDAMIGRVKRQGSNYIAWTELRYLTEVIE